MAYTDNDYDLEEHRSKAQQPSRHSSQITPSRITKDDSNAVAHLLSSSSSSTDSMFEENYAKKLTDRVLELKAELPAHRHFDWLTQFEPSEHNPKIELNLLLHGAIREQTLRQVAFAKGIPFDNDQKTIAQIFQNDDLLLQRIFQELAHDRRQQRIIYTEILFRPDVFTSDSKMSNVQIKRIINVIIDCIRSLACANLMHNTINTAIGSHTIGEITRMNSFTPYDMSSTPMDLKLILSCNWNNVENMTQFIRFARDYPDEVVGIDFYGEEDDCRTYWHHFRNYTKTLRHLRIPFQASMNNYQDVQLIVDVIKDLGIDRLSEAYHIVLSSKHMENIFIKHGVHLVVCPTSSSYATANQLISDNSREASKDEEYQSNSSIEPTNTEKALKEITPFHLIEHLQCERVNYSITSFSPIQFKHTLSSVYKSLLEESSAFFICEDMQRANENAVRASFASQISKVGLMKYLHENYINCYEYGVLSKYIQESTNKWQAEKIEIIDKNARIAAEFATKMHEDKIRKCQNDQHAMRIASVKEEDEYEETEVE